MTMDRIKKQDDQRITLILEALEKWQQMTGQEGILLDQSITFYSADSQAHQLDAGWVPEWIWSQRSVAEAGGKPYLNPSFAVKLTGPDDPEFSRNQAEMATLRDHGCQLGWLIEPSAEYVYIFQPGLPVHQIPTFDYYIDGREVLKGFEFPLRCLRYGGC